MSGIQMLPALDIFSLPTKQESVEGTVLSEHRPATTITGITNAITFRIQSALDEYIDLSSIMLYVKLGLEIKNVDGTTATTLQNFEDTSPVNLMLYAMFKSVDIEINSTAVTSSSQTHPYRAYFQVLTNFSKDARETWLSSAGYTKENSYSDLDKASPIRCKWFKPATSSSKGKEYTFYGKLMADIVQQNKYLPGGLDLRITLSPHSPNFYFMSTNQLSVKPQFTDLSLFVKRVKVAPSVLKAHQLLHQKTPYRFPITHCDVKSYIINAGINSITLENIVLGKQPRRAYVAFTSHKAFDGDLLKNPFAFKHYNLNYLSFTQNGVTYPSRPFTPDYKNVDYLREYLSIYDCLNELTTDTCVGIHRDSFTDGNVIYGVNFAKDNSEGHFLSGHINTSVFGNLRLELKFGAALTENINCIIYLETDSLIEIQPDGTVTRDFV